MRDDQEHQRSTDIDTRHGYMTCHGDNDTILLKSNLGHRHDN